MLTVQLPCGTRHQISSRISYGRGNPPSLSDPQLSREQVLLEPVEGMAGVLQLTNTGMNPIIVESQQLAQHDGATADTAAAAARSSGVLGPSAASWQLTDLLDKGQSTIIGPSSRFYLASRQGTTTFTVFSLNNIVQQQQQQRRHEQRATPSRVQPRQQEQEAADAALAAALHAEEEQQQQQWQQRRQSGQYGSAAMAATTAAAAAAAQQLGPGSISKQEQEAADAALAAAIAAEDSGEEYSQGDCQHESGSEQQQQQQQQQGPDSSGEQPDSAAEVAGQQGSDWPANAAGEVATAAAAAATDRPAKRARLQQQQRAAAAAASASSSEHAAYANNSLPPPSVGDAPFSLLAVRGLPAAANAGCLGARLSQLVCGRLAFVLVSNFMVDMGWLLSACPAIRTADKVIVVHGEKGAYATHISEQAAAAGGLTSPRFACHAPPLPITYGTHHSKAFLLGYEHGGVRLIIHTANAIYPDCNNKTQGLWYQDFPPKTSDSPSHSEFELSLSDYVRCLKLPGSWAADVARLIAAADWSAARAALVPSVPGYHAGPVKLHAYGHMRVRALLASTHIPQRFKSSPCLMQFSSIGSLDEKWLRQEFLASLTAGKYVDAPAAAAAAAEDVVAAAAAGAAAVPIPPGNAFTAMRRAAGGFGVQPGDPAAVPLHIVWASVSEVQHSREGWAGGGSMPGRSDNVAKPFLQQYYCRWGGEPVGRQSAMPHIKSYTRFIPAASRQQPRPQGDTKPQAQGDSQPQTPGNTKPQPAGNTTPRAPGSAELAWWLLASHNLSKAAWGSLQKGGSQLMIRSYELGVLLTPELEAAYRRHPHRNYSCTAEPHLPPAAAVAAEPAGAAAGTKAPVRFYAWPGIQQQIPPNGTAAAAAGMAAAMPSAAADSSTVQGSTGSTDVPVLLPVPYRLPPQQYTSDDKPWCVDVVHPGQDQFGYACGETPLKYYGNVEAPW